MKKLLVCLLLISFFISPAIAAYEWGDIAYLEGCVWVVVNTNEKPDLAAFAEELSAEFELETRSIHSISIYFVSKKKTTVELFKELSPVPYVVSVEPSGKYFTGIIDHTTTIEEHPADCIALVGETVMFNVRSYGAIPLTYQWQTSKDGGSTWNNIIGANTVYHSFTVQAGDNGTQFRAVVSGKYGTATSNAAKLTFDPAATAPTIIRHPMPWHALIDTMATFSVTATGTEPLTYQWQGLNNNDIWNDIAGANSADYSFIATGNEMPLYRVVVSNDYGSATSNSARLTSSGPHPIRPQIIVNKQPSRNTEVREGSITGSLSVEATILPNGTITYQWYSNTTNSNTDGTLIPGETSASFTIPKTLTQSGSPYYYYCVLDGAGTELTQAAMITVNNSDSGNGGGGCNGIMLNGAMLLVLSALWGYGLRSKNRE